jgi:hypothetical protein
MKITNFRNYNSGKINIIKKTIIKILKKIKWIITKFSLCCIETFGTLINLLKLI